MKPQEWKAYRHLCHFTYMNHQERSSKGIKPCAKKSAQRSNTYVTSCTWNMKSVAAQVSTHVPRRVHSVATHMSLYHSMYMNRQERTTKNVFTAPTPTRRTPQAMTSVGTSLPLVHQEPAIKNVITALPTPHPPEPPKKKLPKPWTKRTWSNIFMSKV